MGRRRRVLFATAVSLALVLPATSARADGKGPHDWHVDGPPFGPNVSEAKDGYRIELEGAGSFFVGRRTTAVGGGTFRLLNRGGQEVTKGMWELNGRARYEDHGELMPLSVIDRYRRGILTAPVAFERLGAGTLTIYCAAGDEETEGIRLRLDKRNFSTIVTGATIFRHADSSPLPGPLAN